MPETLFSSTKKNSDDTRIYQLIYHSYASAEFGMDDLLKMLVEARISNDRKMITGMLIYHDAQFLQLLEGEEQALKRLSALIYEDPRHHTAVQLSFKPVKSRDFPSWSMGFANLDNNTERSIRGLRHFVGDEIDWEAHVYEASAAEKLFMSLKNTTAPSKNG